ncbi:MAG: DNA-binding protein [Desulfuromonadales bacterium]|nr:DNA-binding protein [Desulfuromonadales bacterium]
MKNRILFSALLFILVLLVGCQQNSSSQSSTPQPQAPAPPVSNNISGSVVETMNALGYTYVLVETDNQQVWAATPQFAVGVGDLVVIPEGMPMHNYHSQTLDRTFDVVYFVDSILNASSVNASSAAPAQGEMPTGHPPIAGMGGAAPAPIVVSPLDKLENGLNIEEIYAARNDLSGQEIQLRGKVVKFSPQIMGTNWVHLQDGSGSPAAGNHDLTLTSNNQLKVGDVVVARGKLTTDKDFGHGYVYDLIVENAVLSVE